jgi:hypothetical protein
METGNNNRKGLKMTDPRYQTSITRTEDEVKQEKVLLSEGVIRSIKDIYRRGLLEFTRVLSQKNTQSDT